MLDLALQQNRRTPLLSLETGFGPVRLAVTRKAPALKIWRDIVGLTLLREEGHVLTLGVGDKPLIVLEANAARPVVPKSLGLYHVALHVPQRADLARFVLRSLRAGLNVSPTDHLVSEAVYAWDEDGNGIEMTFETPWRGRVNEAGADIGAFAITTDGQPHSGREPIDVEGLLQELEGDPDPVAPLPQGTRIGHVHLHVTDLEEAMRFYRDVIGFAEVSLMPKWGMGDVGLDYAPHALAFNVWAGKNAAQPPEAAAGLRHFTITLPDMQNHNALKQRLIDYGADFSEVQGALDVADPFGNRMRIIMES